MSEKTHYYVRSLILLGFSLLLGRLLINGEIHYYLAPRLQHLAYVTLGILVILTCSCFLYAVRGTRYSECDCGESHSLPKGFWKTTVVYGLFVLPLVMSFLLPNKLLGTAVAEMKGVNLLKGNAKQQMAASASITQQNRETQSANVTIAPPDGQAQNDTSEPAKTEPTPPQKPMNDQELHKKFDLGFGDYYTDLAVSFYKQPILKINDENYLDAMTILELYPKEFAGKKVETMGFVYKEPEFASNEFVAARFTVTCCTADASVTGILIQSPDAKTLSKDSWVKASGTLQMTTMDGNDFLMMVADKVTPVKPPKTPYVYYNYASEKTPF